MTVKEYLEKVPSEMAPGIERIRQKVHEMVPQAEEVITYGMPGFKYRGKYLLAFAAFKNHMSLFPGAEPITNLEGKLPGHVISKGTIQFTADQPIPDTVLREIITSCKERNERT